MPESISTENVEVATIFAAIEPSKGLGGSGNAETREKQFRDMYRAILEARREARNPSRHQD